MINLMWDLKQDSQIKGAKLSASAASHQARNARHATSDLELKLDKLTLLCQAMWSLLREKTDLTEDDLAKRATDIDLMDGKLDGKYTKPIVKCKKCDAAVSHQFNKCLFCGEVCTDESDLSSF